MEDLGIWGQFEASQQGLHGFLLTPGARERLSEILEGGGGFGTSSDGFGEERNGLCGISGTKGASAEGRKHQRMIRFPVAGLIEEGVKSGEEGRLFFEQLAVGLKQSEEGKWFSLNSIEVDKIREFRGRLGERYVRQTVGGTAHDAMVG